MFIVRGKSGKVVGKYHTKAEAERRVAQLKAGAARLRPFQFAGGRTSRSPTPINLEVVPSQHGGYVLGYPDGTFWTPSGPLSWPPSSWTGPTSGRWYSLEGAQKALNNIRRGKEPEPDEPKVKENHMVRGGRSPSTGIKQKVYRGFLIKVNHGGTWCEGNIYRKDGSIESHIASGSCGPGASQKAATINKIIERGERIIDAMQGD